MGIHITAQYGGYDLTYTEMWKNWRCAALDLEDKTAEGLAKKIDAWSRDSRRLGVPVWEVGGYSPRANGAVTAVMLDGDSEVWCSTPGEGNKPPVRRKVKIADLVADDDETREAVAEYKRLNEQISALERKRRCVFNHLPRLTLEQLKALNTETGGDL